MASELARRRIHLVPGRQRPVAGRQGGDHDRQDENRHVEEPLDKRVLGQVPVLVEHGLGNDERP
jgi:hypothetical protein